MVFVFLVRVLMFYNPVILMEFRRIVQEEEKICDDLSAAMTGNRGAIAGALRKFFFSDEDHQKPGAAHAERLRDRIEDYSHAMLIESRITRLEAPPAQDVNGAIVFLIVLGTILAVNFYVV